MTPVPDDFLQRAQKSLETANMITESDADTAASKAYYAVFYAFSAYFSKSGKFFKSHAGVETAADNDLIRAGILNPDIGSDYNWLAALRSTGDYGGSTHVSIPDAKKAIERATAVVAEVTRTIKEK